jgi:hypothetical protein
MSAGRSVAERTDIGLAGTPLADADWVEAKIMLDIAAAGDDEYVAFICALGERPA